MGKRWERERLMNPKESNLKILNDYRPVVLIIYNSFSPGIKGSVREKLKGV